MSARVRVVDDDPDIRTVVRTALQLADFTVLEAADGTEALARAATERPHVIVLDRMMPGMDGIDVLRHLRRDHYAFRRGDEVLVAFATMVTEVVDDLGDRHTFVGHVGGDDFVVVTGLGAWEALAREICLRFDAAVPQLYDADDRGRAVIRVADRQGTTQTYPFVGVSIGAAVFGPGECTHPEELVSVATEMKAFAKGEVAGGGSNVAVDRRRGTPATTT